MESPYMLDLRRRNPVERALFRTHELINTIDVLYRAEEVTALAPIYWTLRLIADDLAEVCDE